MNNSSALFLDIELSESTQALDVFLSDSNQTLDVEMIGGGEGRFPYYDGAYVVDPRKVAQVLETKDKSMSDDVTINAIFYSEVSNPAGGDTCYIGIE